MPNLYTAPYSLSDFPITIPSEGQFTVPVCTTPERYQKILNALFYYGVSQYEFDFDHLIDFLDASTRIVDGCVDFSEQCREIGLRDERISWFPENPFTPEMSPPSGYPFHPFTVVTGGTLSGIIGEFGLGYQSGDVFVDLTKLPSFSSWLDIASNYANMPRIQVNNLVGRGKVTFHLLNIVQGSRMLVVVDDVVDILHLQTIEVGRDAISFPPETQVDFLVEIPISTEGTHTVALVIYPTVDVSAIPISFGGGFRNIALCGFGVSPMTDPCCPETNDILGEILSLLKGGATIRFEAVDNPPTDTIIDCAPPQFDGDDTDEVTEQIRRAAALCLTVERFVSEFIVQMCIRLNMGTLYINAAKQIPTISIGGLQFAPVLWRWLTATTIYDVKNWIDTPYYPDAICVLLTALQGTDSTFANFKSALDTVDTSSMSDSEKRLYEGLRLSMQSEQTYEGFVKHLNYAYEDVGDNPSYECPCGAGTCDADQFVIIGLNGTVVTKTGVATWRVQQSNFTVPDPVNFPDVRQYKVTLRDQFWRCINVYTYSEAMSGYLQYNCSGAEVSGGGGGGGSGVLFNFFHNQSADYHAIDSTMLLLCP